MCTQHTLYWIHTVCILYVNTVCIVQTVYYTLPTGISIEFVFAQDLYHRICYQDTQTMLKQTMVREFCTKTAKKKTNLFCFYMTLFRALKTGYSKLTIRNQKSIAFNRKMQVMQLNLHSIECKN